MSRSDALAIHALGGFRVLRDGRAIPRPAWQSRMGRDLVKILVSRRGQPIAREELIEMLWPDTDPRRTRNRLSVLLYTVRTVLAGDSASAAGPVVADPFSIRLDLDLVDVDVERFLARAGRALEADRRGDPDAADLLRAAEAAYGGDFCLGDPYADWASQLRDECRAVYLAVSRALADASRLEGRADHAVLYLLRLLRHDRYDERAHLDLVDTLCAAGRHGEAHRRYQAYAAQMAELGIEPARRELGNAARLTVAATGSA